MALDKLFTRYGHLQNEMDINIHLNHTRADKIDNTNHIALEDRRAAEEINIFLAYAELLKEYRKTLYDRAQEFYSADYKYLLKITRTVEMWKNNKKFYTITVEKIYNLPKARPETVITEAYQGTERHKALKRFEELQKIYPNIETEKDIDKKYWER
ncbi:MAG: hypothetical protein LUI60_02040 [Clostridia bacterium]|nr:hypothetical protein [Clostridia bacterium]